ncbi:MULTISPECIES: LacI family DNA-binding transcriptional regulator [unclassified Microbacterium]|uniref:LacI family DNA-binding transcriptional regulator n=1 Tax=unclassified Microbacterium TaxID=2609290 RepID=UPI00214AB51A|nr:MULTISPECIES: LacI family DNA-binding transcriptional regulator [unclassified Microbacterium]MCR2783880.1 LacI family transcriptional regulator [Microbacterium sp. zg.B96]WIM15274.1 LacI family DNA-binding transcriptional regulator [Microbacterium sp. zg-B96]
MVTVYDVAQACGLSIASVSRALNGQPGVSQRTAERICLIADQLGYQRNEVARSLVAKSTQTIALFVPDITNPFFPELVKGVQSVADERDLLLLLLDAPRSAVALSARLAALRRKQVDGILLVASDIDADTEELVAGTPAVLLDRGRSGRHASVGVDQEAAGFAATRHLIDAGHTRIGHIAGPQGLAVSELRRAGWERALREAGLPVGDHLVAVGDFEEEGGHRAGAELLQREPGITAVFAANDLSAIGFLACCSVRGIPVPEQMSVIGLDGIGLSRYTTPMLTTIAQPIRELGVAACRLLLRQLDGDGQALDVVLPTTLVEGASVSRRGGA